MAHGPANGSLDADSEPEQPLDGPALPPISEVARSLAAAVATDEVMQLVADGALRVTRGVGAYVERIASARDEVEVVATAGDSTPPLHTRVAYPGSLTEAIIGGEEPRDLVRMENIGEAIAPYLAHSCRGCSALVVPLISQREALGALVLLRGPGSVEFPASEVADVRTLADLASLSLRRVQLLEASERERYHMAALLHSTGEGIYGVDRDLRCTFINPAAARMLGRAPEECLGANMHSLIHHHHADGTHYPEDECPIVGAIRAGRGFRREDEVLWRKDGSSFPAEYASYPIVQDDEIRGAVVTFVDITNWKRTEQERDRALAEARAAREQIAQMLMRAPAAMALMVGPEHRIEIANPRFRRLSGDRDLTGMTVREAFPELRDSALFERLDRVYRTGSPWEGRAVPVRYGRDGTDETGLHHFDLRYEPIRDAGGDVYAVLSFAMDVTEAVQARQALEAARAEAEEARGTAERARRAAEEARHEADQANRAKSEFLANMSHEIRTPLNAIMGYTDLLEIGVAGPITEGQQGYLARTRTSAEHLVGLIDEILDLARIEAGRMHVEHERALAIDAVVSALALVGPQAAQRQIEIEEPCADEEIAYIGDQDRVRQILVNLLSNAIKFTPGGGRIGVECGNADAPPPSAVLTDSGERAWAYVRVTDAGIGIAADQIDTIFDAFVQVDRGHSRSYEGTGLGLAISRQLARLMGGDLTVESTLGEGSEFTLWLPKTPPLDDELVLGAAEGDVPRGAAATGEALLREVNPVTEAYLQRLRADPQTPMAADLGPADLEDHLASLLSDLGATLVTLETSESTTAELLHDSGVIQRVISDLHGRQRARLRWTEAALLREFQVLREEVESGVRRGLAPDAEVDLDATIGLLKRLIQRSENISLRAFRTATAAADRRG